MDEILSRSPGVGEVSGPAQRTKTAFTLVEVLVVIAIIGILVARLLPSVRRPREAARRSQCASNLKHIAAALQNYEKVHGALPPAHTTDAEGKPLHSWRTLILPFLEELELYNSIDLSKPWDDPANANAVKKCPGVYQCPSAPGEDNYTHYLAIVTPNSCFLATEPRNVSDITDPAKETLIVIEVDAEHAVPWMSPIDADENVVLGLGGPQSRTPHPGIMSAAFVDGHVYGLSAEVPAAVRRALISIAGNDKPAVEGTE